MVFNDLPATASYALPGDFRGSEFAPFALYSTFNISSSELQSIAKQLEGDWGIELDNGGSIDLVSAAPDSIARQPTLENALQAHLNHVSGSQTNPPYFPYGLVILDDADFKTRGVWIVYADFEKPHEVTAFRVKWDLAGDCLTTLRNDDDGVKELKEQFALS